MYTFFSWTTVLIALVALALILIALRVFKRIRLTFRFRGAVTVSPWTQDPCPHLGLLEEPFIHRDEPTEDHRCYLWMQRDRIDLSHQKGFCLSPAHDHCPWLTIAPPATNAPLSQRMKAAMSGAAITSRGSPSNFVQILLEWLSFKLQRAMMVTEQRTGITIPVIVALTKICARQLGKWSVVAGRIIASASIVLGETVHAWTKERLGSTSPQPADMSREALSKRSQPAAEASVPEGGIPSLQARPGAAGQIAGLVEQGKIAGMGGNRKLAHTLFSLALDLDPKSDEAWLWRGAMSDDDMEKLACFQRALALNPSNEKAQQALKQVANGPWAAPVVEPEPVVAAARVETPGISPHPAADVFADEEALMTAALEALEKQDEDAAYHLFVRATMAYPQSEKAWFWRAKTAATLDDIILSLQKAIAINPTNEKVKANLLWAMQRKQVEEQAKEAEQRAVVEEAKVRKHAKADTSTRVVVVGFRWVAAMICLALAAFWVSAAILPVMDLPIVKDIAEQAQGVTEINLDSARPAYESVVGWLPGLTWASFPWHDKLEIVSGYNLLAAVPYTIGFLYFFVGIGVLKREKWSHFWGFVLSALSLVLGILCSTNSRATFLVITLGLATIVMLLVSRSEFKRDAAQRYA